jgi:hypothetical protein
MSQIKTQIIRQGLQSRNVLSSSFFTMANEYRPVERYIKHLKQFLQYQEKLGFECRIYTDESGIEYVLPLAEKYNVTVIQFDCQPFREGKGHVGTFGTMARFLPMFEDLDLVWVSDLDIPPNFLDPKLVEFMNKKKLDGVLRTMTCYDRKPYGRQYTIIADRMLVKPKFQQSSFTTFLKKLANGELQNWVDALNEGRNKGKHDIFPYGMDEVFLNTVIYDSIKRRKLPYAVEYNYGLTSGFFEHNTSIKKSEIYVLENHYSNPTKESVKKVKQIYKTYLPDVIEKYPCASETMDMLDSLPYTLSKVYFIHGEQR